jgi:hypothetical protein
LLETILVAVMLREERRFDVRGVGGGSRAFSGGDADFDGARFELCFEALFDEVSFAYVVGGDDDALFAGVVARLRIEGGFET